MKKAVKKYISMGILLILALPFVAKFGEPAILKAYIENSVGNCEKIPILCSAPEEELVNSNINEEYLSKLILYKFPEIEMYIPEGFNVVKEMISKPYYRKRHYREKAAFIYLLYEKPNFFVNLFPQVSKQGIKDDYEFLGRTMSAQLNQIKNLADMFFVIMKSIFTPDLGDQKNIKMVKFSAKDKKGFINYNLGSLENYFDCNVVTNQGDFFIYIKDKGKKLDLGNVLAIISTINVKK